MIAFLRLEWVRLFSRAGSTALLAFAGALLTFGALSWPLGSRWVLPEGLPYGSLPAAWVLSALIGVFTFGWDEASGSQEFAVHRGVSRARLARSRLLLGGGLALSVPLAGFLLPGLMRLPFDANASIVRFEAILRDLVALSCCISAFAAGAFAASTRARPLVRALLGLAVILAVAVSTWRLLDIHPDKWFRTYGSFLGAQAFWGAILLPSAVVATS
jgi:hypothetical protein